MAMGSHLATVKRQDLDSGSDSPMAMDSVMVIPKEKD
jgi:hypothetical protein